MKIIRVSLSNPASREFVATDFLDAKEEVFGKLLMEHSEAGKIPDMDAGGYDFQIHVFATRHLGTVNQLLKKALTRRKLLSEVVIERLDAGS